MIYSFAIPILDARASGRGEPRRIPEPAIHLLHPKQNQQPNDIRWTHIYVPHDPEP